MNIQQKLAEIEQAGIRLSASGHNIAYEPKRKLTRNMALWLVANKPAVLEILNTENKQKKQLVYKIIEGLIKTSKYTDEVQGYAMQLLEDEDKLSSTSLNELEQFRQDINDSL